MAKIWVKGYTKPDGTKVKGHFREVSGRMLDPKRQRQVAARIRLGEEPEKALQKGVEIARRGGRQSTKALKKQYGSALARNSRGSSGSNYIPSWVRIIGSKI
jgi:hypothetical protein